jgi:hypothetical protein
MTHKTLGELILTDFDAARPILEAWARGEALEFDSIVGWDKDPDKYLSQYVTYRIPPRPHTVDWSQVGERIVAFETNNRGHHYAFGSGGDYYAADFWPSFRPGTDGGRIERPKEVK